MVTGEGHKKGVVFDVKELPFWARCGHMCERIGMRSRLEEESW
jgi:hypothetical protein